MYKTKKKRRRENLVCTYVVQSRSSSRSQTMIVLSALPLAKNLESEEKAKHMTIEACAVNALNACPDGTYDRAASHYN